MQGKTFRQIAKNRGKHEAYVGNVSRGWYFVPGIARILAYESGFTIKELWPDEYEAGLFSGQ